MPRFRRLKSLVKRLSISSSSAESEKLGTTPTAVSLDNDDNAKEENASHASKSTKWTTVESRDSVDDDDDDDEPQQRTTAHDEERRAVPTIVVTEESAWEAGAEVSYDDFEYGSHSEDESPISERLARDFGTTKPTQ